MIKRKRRERKRILWEHKGRDISFKLREYVKILLKRIFKVSFLEEGTVG